jgi:hypothetical protein
LAIQVAETQNLPVYVLYYEDYATRFEATVSEVANFLDQRYIGNPIEFVADKQYSDYYNDKETIALTELVQELATPKCWELLRRYFVDTNSKSDSIRASSSPEVALLLSFPNSGTTFTLENTEKMSNRTVATNYAFSDSLEGEYPVFANSPDGPFLYKNSLSVPRIVLTKTHCSPGCDMCPLKRSVQTLNDFKIGCFQGNNLAALVTHYNSSIAKKAVHLFRDPFDNIVSRM